MRVSAGVPPEEDIPFAILQQMERDYNEQQQAAGAGQGGAHGNVSVFFAPLYTKKPNLCQDRLGTTREQLKRRNIFLQGLVVVVRMLTRMMYRARAMRNLTYRANCREAGAWRYRSALL